MAESVTMGFSLPLGHPPLEISCALMFIVAFPFLSIAYLRRRPQIRLVYYFLPLMAGLVLACYGVFMSFRGAPVVGFTFRMVAGGVGESMSLLMYGAASSFLTALFRVRSPQHGLRTVLVVAAVVGLTSWLVQSRLLHFAMTGSLW